MTNMNLDSLTIELATYHHIPYLTRLKEGIMRTVYLPTEDDKAWKMWRDHYCTETYFKEAIQDPNRYVFSIGSLREPAGTMMLIQHDAKTVEVDDLLVSTRGSGIGTRLIKSSLRYAEAWRAERIIVELYPNHPHSETFLEKHGFKRIGDTQNALGMTMHRWEAKLKA
jgi:GNAT superfamily N-acetyltransferase